ncbi:hypothetical protein [Salinigranum sp. GCM10025319]|uniref:hypothetical protein n=1 Tax=Salinigranum sp. GCM10025319 TaxID=3252687 RepID=UPI00360FA01A
MVRRTHHCRRCDAAIDPGDVYAAVDVLDADGRIRALLCRSCGAALRAFVEGRDREDDGTPGDSDGAGTPCASDGDGEATPRGPDDSPVAGRDG